MLNEDDINWLAEYYPVLTATTEEISGAIEITATYNLETNRFLNLSGGVIDAVGGIRLSGSFTISIRERVDKPFSELPGLRIDGLEANPARHINRSDGTACLGSPLDEGKYLIPEFRFQPFFEELVIPFLYGQLFFSREGFWPWPDYDHGSIGLLESYARLADSSMAEKCLKKLSNDKEWPVIRALLRQRSDLKGHTLCFCESKGKMKNCHPEALDGLKKLQVNTREQGLMLQ